MEPAQETAAPSEDPLRFEFVELMFALAAAEVAVEVATVAERRASVFHAAAYAHAGLALLVIATSWVGWKTSKAAGNRQLIRGVFEWPFAILLLDVLLVVLYYVLAHGVEKPDENGFVHPSAKNETIVMSLIFLGYVVWDVLTKWVMDAQATAASLWRRLRWSLLCLVLATVTWFLLGSVERTAAVLLTDAALIMLVLAFRALKQTPSRWRVVSLSAERVNDSETGGWGIQCSPDSVIAGAAVAFGSATWRRGSEMC